MSLAGTIGFAIAVQVAARTVFSSANLRATLIEGSDDRLLVVTFSSYQKGGTLDRPGFGEDFLREEGIAAIHVVAAGNRWFQHPELPDLLAAIRAVAAGHARTIAYGSSMGGFAALTYGAEAGADTAIAFSPQVSLDRRVAPFETRWRAEARAIRRWRPGIGRLAAQVIAYDPYHAIDAAHAAAFADRAPTIAIPVPHGGHPAGAALSQADLLKRLVRDVAADRIDAPDYARILRDRRGESPQYLYTVARRLAPHHGTTKLALAERAAARDPSPHNHVLAATCLMAMGRDEEAETRFRTALDHTPGDVDALAAYADFLAARDRPAEAAGLIAAARARMPDSSALRWRQWRLLGLRLWRRRPRVIRRRFPLAFSRSKARRS